MNYIYVFLPVQSEWEDIILFTDINEALKKSIKYPNTKVEIFKTLDHVSYLPTYAFLKGGKLDITNKLKEIQLDPELIKLI